MSLLLAYIEEKHKTLSFIMALYIYFILFSGENNFQDVWAKAVFLD